MICNIKINDMMRKEEDVIKTEPMEHLYLYPLKPDF